MNPSTSTTAAQAVEAALLALGPLQDKPKGTQVAAVFLLANIMVHQLGLNVSEMMDQAQRRYDFFDTYYKRECQALTDYVNGELR